jgi:hypothetical protein
VRQKLAVLFNLCYNYIIRKNKGVYMNLTDEQLKALDVELVTKTFSLTNKKATIIVDKVYELINARLINKKDFINIARAAKLIIENE